MTDTELEFQRLVADWMKQQMIVNAALVARIEALEQGWSEEDCNNRLRQLAEERQE